MPLDRRVSRKSRIFSRALMFSAENSSPLGLNASPCFSTTSAASGISLVITRSPACRRLTISLSATSKPATTCSILTLAKGGVRSAWLATRVTLMPVRSAARNSISLITTGQASASTQICIWYGAVADGMLSRGFQKSCRPCPAGVGSTPDPWLTPGSGNQT